MVDRSGARVQLQPDRESSAFDEQLKDSGFDDHGLVQKIRRSGSWRLRIRPAEFHEAALASSEECKWAIERASVTREGRRYPALRSDQNGTNWISGSIDNDMCPELIEYWRFFQSGQFIQEAAIWEDLVRPDPRYFQLDSNRRYLDDLDVGWTIIRLTDTMEFTARLASQGVFGASVFVGIEWNKMAARILRPGDSVPALPRSYHFPDNAVTLGGSYNVESLIARHRELAIDLAQELFKKAGWEADRSILVSHQERHTAESVMSAIGVHWKQIGNRRNLGRSPGRSPLCLATRSTGACNSRLVADPAAGVVLRGGNGIRKIRIAVGSRGKRGGARVIYCWAVRKHVILMLFAYSKTATVDLTPKQVAHLAAAIKGEFGTGKPRCLRNS